MRNRCAVTVAGSLLAALGWAHIGHSQEPAISELPRATVCRTKMPLVIAGGAAMQSTIRVSSNGGWCWIELSATTGSMKYVPTYIVSKIPAHGEILMGEVNGRRRIAFRPVTGFVGDDSFVLVNQVSNSERAVTVTIVK
jgi:hypothetical protein